MIERRAVLPTEDAGKSSLPSIDVSRAESSPSHLPILAPKTTIGIKRKGLEPTGSRPLKNPGGALLSHTLSGAVPSAQEGLTSLFGKGRGVSPPPSPPKNRDSRSSFTLCYLDPIPVGPRFQNQLR